MDEMLNDNSPLIERAPLILNSKRKLKSLLLLVHLLPIEIREVIFDLIVKYYSLYTSSNHPIVKNSIKRRVHLAVASLKYLDPDVASFNNVSTEELYKWRLEVSSIIYYILQVNKSDLQGIDFQVDEQIESQSIYKTIVSILKEREHIMSIFSNEETSELLEKVPGLRIVLINYLKKNSIADVLIHYKILDKDDPQYFKKVGTYNYAFRKFLFTHEDPAGINKVISYISWVERSKKQNYEINFIRSFRMLYEIDPKRLEPHLRLKLSRIKKVIEWIIAIEHGKRLGSALNYSEYLRMFEVLNPVPIFLIRIFKQLIDDPNGQSLVTKSWKNDYPYKESNSYIGYFLSFIEELIDNNKIDFNYEDIENYFSRNRNRNLLNFRTAAINLWNKDSVSITES